MGDDWRKTRWFRGLNQFEPGFEISTACSLEQWLSLFGNKNLSMFLKQQIVGFQSFLNRGGSGFVHPHVQDQSHPWV